MRGGDIPYSQGLRRIRNKATPTTTIAPITPPMIGSNGRLELPVVGEFIEPTASDTVVE
jgi:hypothetical protein